MLLKKSLIYYDKIYMLFVLIAHVTVEDASIIETELNDLCLTYECVYFLLKIPVNTTHYN